MADTDKAENNGPDVPKQGSLRSRLGRSHAAWLAFAFAALVSSVFVAIDARGTLPAGDEWDYFHRLATQPLPEALFDAPINKYLLTVPLFTIYLPQAEIFGLGEVLPLRIAGIGLVVLVAGLTMELSRRRAGYAFGLAAGILLLFFGAAGEVVVTPQRIPGLMAACFGLGMLLALDRQDRRGDVIAAVCGVLGIASHPVMLPFLAGAGVRVLFGKRDRLKRSALVLLPAAIAFGVWRIAFYEQKQSIELSFGGTVDFAVDHVVALMASITGLFRGPFAEGTDFVNGFSVAAAILAGVVLVFVVVRRRGLTLGLGAALFVLVVASIAPTLGPSAVLTSPVEPRYIHPGSIIILLVLAELVAAGRPWPRGSGFAASGAALIWLVVAMPANVASLHERADIAASSGDLIRAELGALELASTVPGSVAEQAMAPEGTQEQISALAFSGDLGEESAGLLAGGAAVYFDIAEVYGTPALNADMLATTRPELRRDADIVYLLGTPLRPVPAVSPPPGLEADARAPQRLDAGGDLAAGSCAAVTEPDEPQVPEPEPPPEGVGAPLQLVNVPPGEAWIGGENVEGLRVGRFADTATSTLTLAPETDATLPLPVGGAESQPWLIQLYGDGPVTVCAASSEDGA
jgi:hypothetical protein